MLTINPPEAREDEIQAEPTDKDGFMLKLSPTRLNAKRKARNAHGFNYIQLIVGMIIFVALSRIVGPPAFRMITRARSTALSANIQTAAETVRNVLAIDPAKRGTPPAGVPTDTFLAALTDDAPFNWNDTWQFETTDDSDTIRVQFVDKDAAQAVPAVAVSPKVGWLLTEWDAVRIHARNQDGAWACALVVLKPDVDELDTFAGNDDIVNITGADTGANTNPVTVAVGNARLRGIWYDSGDTYTAGVGANGDAFHCSPTVESTAAVAAGCSVGAHTTALACHGAGGAFVPPIAAGLTIDPLPGGADVWGITTDRAMTRNL